MDVRRQVARGRGGQQAHRRLAAGQGADVVDAVLLDVLDLEQPGHDVGGGDIKRVVIAVVRRGDGVVRHADLADALARLLAQRPAAGDEADQAARLGQAAQVTEEERGAIAQGLRARGNGG